MAVKVALIGYGHLGKWHCEKALNLPTAKLVAIVEPTEDGKKRAQKDHPTLNVVSDIAEIYHTIDAALVVSTTETHFAISKKLLLNGVHVFCEKPLSSTFLQARELADLAKQKSLVLQVGHSERFHHCWELGKEKYPGFFSHPSYVHIKRVAPFKGRATDVDVVQDLMIHDIDLCLSLFTQKPLWVEGLAVKCITKNWDFCKVIFGYENNLRIDIQVGRNAIKEERYLEITNSSGQLHFDLFNNSIIQASFDKKLNRTVNDEISYEKRDHLYLEQKMFYRAILSNESPLVTGEDGANAVFIVEKVLESIQKKERITLTSMNQ